MTRPASTLAGSLCLVTGGAGYIGHSLTLELLDAGARVRRLFRAGRRPALEHPNVENVIGDVTVRSDLARACANADVVFHLAGQTSVYTADRDPIGDFEANVRPVTAIAELCLERTPSPRVVLAGTSTVTGVTLSVPIDPGRRDAPVSIYDLHKLMAEQYLEFCARVRGLSATTLRLCNVYGPGPPSASSDRGILNQMIRRALNGEALTVYGEGNQIRDYAYVGDVARAFRAAAEAPAVAVSGRHFVVGTGLGHTVRSAVSRVAELVGARTGREVPVTTVTPPAGLSPIENRFFVADPAPFEEASGFRPRVTLDEGIERTLDHLALQEKSK
ncbi:MAG TPA: NAD-dependent epimerase/dehydratase family protein [Polyangiaceae bacterium]